MDCRFGYDLTKTFDVLVGKEPNQQRFTVYHDLMRQRSEFFRAARSEHWITKPDQPTTLDDHEPQTFSLYLHCVNFGAEALKEHSDVMLDDTRSESNKTNANSSDSDSDSDNDSDSNSDSDINSDSDSDSSSEDDEDVGDANASDRKKDGTGDEVEDGVSGGNTKVSSTNENESSEIDSSNSADSNFADCELADKSLVDLYLLADKLMDPVTANLAIEHWISMAQAKRQYPSKKMINYVYGSTVAGSPLRRLIRDWFVYKVSKSWLVNRQDLHYSHDFMLDIMLETYALQRKNKNLRIRDVFFWDIKLVGRPKGYYHQKLGRHSRQSKATGLVPHQWLLDTIGMPMMPGLELARGSKLMT